MKTLMEGDDFSFSIELSFHIFGKRDAASVKAHAHRTQEHC